MKLTIDVTESQAAALVQFCEQEAENAFKVHCRKREADGVKSLLDANTQRAQADEAQTALDWYNIAQKIEEQANKGE